MKAAPSAKDTKNQPKRKISSDDDPWGAWSDNEEIDPSKIDYKNLNLNKLGDKELNKHKAAMDVEFNKKRVTKDHPEFEYDKRKDFSHLRDSNSAIIEEEW